MQSSQSRSRWGQPSRASDDDEGPLSYKVSRDGHRTPPSRTSYEMRPESSSSRSRRDLEEWRQQEDRYTSPSKNKQRRGGRDDYDHRDRGDADSWTPAGDSYHEPSRPRGESRDQGDTSHSGGRDWRQGDSQRRPPQQDDRSRGWNDTDRWSRDANKTQEWRRDNGWESRRRAVAEESSRQHNGHSESSTKANEDRAWEPAPSWRSNSNNNTNRGSNQNQGQRKQGNRNQKGKGKKHKNQQHQHQQPKRDWRNDDSNPNNWTRRDNVSKNSKTNQTVVRRQYYRSPSRSRSRSPPGSYDSRSSPLRSRSPHRRPRSIEGRVHTRQSRSPGNRRPPKQARHGGRSSRSPSPSPISPRGRRSPVSRGRVLRRSPSYTSMTTSSRSRSRTPSRSPTRSPRDRSRMVHRLPVATPVKEISIPKNSQGGNLPPKPRTQKHGKGRNKRGENKSSKMQTTQALHPDVPPSFDMLPPPTTSTFPPASISVAATTSRSTTGKASFKPIVQQSLALKRFFPSEDDDDFEPLGRSSVRQPRDVEAPSRSRSPPTRRQSLSDTLTERTNGTYHSPHERPWMRSSPNRRYPRDGRSPSPPPTYPTPPMDSHKMHHKYGSQNYSIVSQVGEGTFGKVYKAMSEQGQVVALKRIRMEAERDGFPVTAMREIKLLQSLKHPNIVQLWEMLVSNGSVYMVFEYMDHDLTGVLSQTQFTFSESNLKSLCEQMLKGLAYLHHKGVIHRDIKGSNILLNNRGELKLGDFGLARVYHKRRQSDYTNRVITLWYRPPELLLGTTVYGPEVDMWSAGCIMLEIFTKKPVFQGNDEIHQLDVIYKILGTPTPERWPGVQSLPWFELVKPKEFIPNRFRELFNKWLSPPALDLAEELLAYDPAKRASAVHALQAPYFHIEHPRPNKPIGLAQLEGEWHELETKRERAKKRRKVDGDVAQS